MMLENAAEWLRSQSMAHLSVPVEYHPVGGGTRRLDAVIGSTVFKSEDEYGAVVTTESRDFIVSAEDLPADPVKGDAIVWNGRRYEVLAPNGEPCWRWSDAYRKMARIHTKEEDIGNGQPA